MRGKGLPNPHDICTVDGDPAHGHQQEMENNHGEFPVKTKCMRQPAPHVSCAQLSVLRPLLQLETEPSTSILRSVGVVKAAANSLSILADLLCISLNCTTHWSLALGKEVRC